MSTCMPVTFLRKVGQKSNNKIISDFKQVNNFRLSRILKQSQRDRMQKIIKIADRSGINPIPFEMFKSRTDNKHLKCQY